MLAIVKMQHRAWEGELPALRAPATRVDSVFHRRSFGFPAGYSTRLKDDKGARPSQDMA
jgi:hypothetical protein